MKELFPTINMRQETFVVELCVKLDFLQYYVRLLLN